MNDFILRLILQFLWSVEQFIGISKKFLIDIGQNAHVTHSDIQKFRAE